MNIKNALIELDNSWSRDIILKKIKIGQPTDKIVNDFIKSNKSNIELFSNYLEKNYSNILENLENLSICETKLIKEIKCLQIKTCVLFEFRSLCLFFNISHAEFTSSIIAESPPLSGWCIFTSSL